MMIDFILYYAGTAASQSLPESARRGHREGKIIKRQILLVYCCSYLLHFSPPCQLLFSETLLQGSFSYILSFSIISICILVLIFFFSSIMVDSDGFLMKCIMGLDFKLRTVSFPENMAWPRIMQSAWCLCCFQVFSVVHIVYILQYLCYIQTLL